MVSVALCTYNGAKYLDLQLGSIFSQTLPVSEINIVDDCSTDNTVAIIKGIQESTIAKIWGGNINLIINEKNIGVIENFRKAISLCKGNLIFLADQDDIWEQNKVERIIEWFKENKGKEVVFTDGYLINDNGERLQDCPTIFDVIFKKNEQKWFNQGFELELFGHQNRAVGATMAFKREIMPFINFSLDTCILHDERICFAAILRGTLGYCDDKLTKYRIHKSQVCGFGNLEKGFEILPLEDPRLYKPKEFFLNNGYLQKRFKFSGSRLSMLKSPLFGGGWWILCHLHKYIFFYKRSWLKFVYYDFRQRKTIVLQSIRHRLNILKI